MAHVELVIDTDLVEKLIAHQFPQWAHLAVRPVEKSGWDNRTFRLGDELLVRLPSAVCYAPQVEKEQRWLPYLAPFLPVAIPVPVALGNPQENYPWHWSVYTWIQGTPMLQDSTDALCQYAYEIAQFLKALHQIPTKGGPAAGAHNFYRGGDLLVYSAEFFDALAILKNELPAEEARFLWEAALKSSWKKAPVWVHGDLAPANLLVNQGHITAVIDFGLCAVGDPACDLALAWTFFWGESREVFRSELLFDSETWMRGRAWVLWKTVIMWAGLQDTAQEAAENYKKLVLDLLDE